MSEIINENNIDPENINDNGSDEPIIVPDQENSISQAFKNKDLIADLRQQLKKCEEEKKEYLLGWQKTKADFINQRKQDSEENRIMIKYAEAKLLSDIVPVLDSFDLATNDNENYSNLPDEWKKGFEQIKNQLQIILAEHGLNIMNPLGKPLDTRESEAIGITETKTPDEDDKVLLVVQRGYKLDDRVIRPAKVKVGKYIEN